MKDRLGPAEFRRRLWHMAPGCLPVFLWIFPRSYSAYCSVLLPPGLLSLATWVFPAENQLDRIRAWSIICTVFVFMLAAIWNYRSIARQDDHNLGGSVIGYASTILLTLALFPGRPEFGLTVAAVIAFGDGSATLGGLLWGGAALPWNSRKTWVGFGCFLLAAGPLSSLYYWAESFPGVSGLHAFACGTSATLAAAIVESIPSRINDNIRVGLTAAVTVVLVHGALSG